MNLLCTRSKRTPPSPPWPAGVREVGISLIELLVGLAIGLLTITVAMRALHMQHSLNHTVSELAQMHQQAAYAFRLLGQQIRQAGDYALQLSTQALEALTLTDLSGQSAVAGTGDTPSTSLTVRVPNPVDSLYKTTSSTAVEAKSPSRNCLQESGTSILSSRFALQDQQLVCAGTAHPQAIAADVSDFQVRYLVQQVHAGETQFQYLSASAMTAQLWPAVIAVEVCLAMTGRATLDTLGSTYVRCDGSVADRGHRQQLVLRSQYTLRSRL